MSAAQQLPVVDWWGDQPPPDAQETEMVEELLEVHPLLTMREALTEVRNGGSAGKLPACPLAGDLRHNANRLIAGARRGEAEATRPAAAVACASLRWGSEAACFHR